jgi:rRNA maturation RNase YbeY
MAIRFVSHYPSFKIQNKKRIADWLLLTATMEEFEINMIEYNFVDDNFLLQLNKKHLKHSYLTDILTFSYSATRSIEAEIYISVDRVRSNARQWKTEFSTELNRVIIHGLLHCMNYSDNTSRRAIRMRKAEEKYLQVFYSEM